MNVSCPFVVPIPYEPLFSLWQHLWLRAIVKLAYPTRFENSLLAMLPIKASTEEQEQQQRRKFFRHSSSLPSFLGSILRSTFMLLARARQLLGKTSMLCHGILMIVNFITKKLAEGEQPNFWISCDKSGENTHLTVRATSYFVRLVLAKAFFSSIGILLRRTRNWMETLSNVMMEKCFREKEKKTACAQGSRVVNIFRFKKGTTMYGTIKKSAADITIEGFTRFRENIRFFSMTRAIKGSTWT